MPFADNLIAFTLAATLLTLTPGPDTALILRTAAVESRRQALRAALGINAGCLLWGAAVAFGLGALIAVSELAYNLHTYCGAAYLAWLGVNRLLRPRQSMAPAGLAGVLGRDAAPHGAVGAPVVGNHHHVTRGDVVDEVTDRAGWGAGADVLHGEGRPATTTVG